MPVDVSVTDDSNGAVVVGVVPALDDGPNAIPRRLEKGSTIISIVGVVNGVVGGGATWDATITAT